MIGSANEIAALATKAARGAGVPPSLAAQFGKAVVHHLAAGFPTTDLQAALAAVPTGPIYTLPAQLKTILETATHQTATGTLTTDAPTSLAKSYLKTLPFAATCTTEAPPFHVTIDTQTPAQHPAITRLTLPDDLAQNWQQLAAKTFVPDTAASRLAGAGAGLTDND